MSTPPTPATPSGSEAARIRPARSEELGAVGRLTVAVYVGDGHVPDDDGYAARLADAADRARHAEVLVAVDGEDRLLGSVTWCPLGSAYREVARADEGEFRMLAVDPAARGRGAGLALVTACVERARALGYGGVRMSTMARMTAAHRVYGRLGFVRSPDDDWSPEPGVDLLVYALRWERPADPALRA